MTDWLASVLRLVPLLAPYPAWVKVLVIVWFLMTVALFTVLLWMYQPASESKAADDTTPQPLQNIEIGSIGEGAMVDVTQYGGLPPEHIESVVESATRPIENMLTTKLRELGYAHETIGRLKESLDQAIKRADQAEAAIDQQDESVMIALFGGNSPKALLAFLISQRSNPSINNVKLNHEIAATAYYAGEIEIAIEAYEMILSVNEHDNLALRMLAVYANNRGDYARSKNLAQIQIDAARLQGDVYKETIGLCERARSLHYQGLNEEAENSLQSAISLANDSSDARIQAKAYSNLSAFLTAIGNSGRAETAARTALRYSEDANDKDSKAQALRNLSRLSFRRNMKDEAVAYAKQALELYKDSGHEHAMASCLSDLSVTELRSDESDETIPRLEEALRIFMRFGDIGGAAGVHGDLAVALQNRGKYSDALAHAQRSAALSEDIGDIIGLADQTGNIGYIYLEQGDLELAEQFQLKCLKLHEKITHPRGRGNAYVNLSRIAALREDQDLQQEYLESALEYFSAGQCLPEALEAIRLLAPIYFDEEAYPKAIALYSQAAKGWTDLDDQAERTYSLYRLGQAYLYHRRKKGFESEEFDGEAIKALGAAVEGYKRNGEDAYAGSALWNLSSYYRAMGDVGQAKYSMVDAREAYDSAGIDKSIGLCEEQLAIIADAMGDPKDAVAHYERSAEALSGKEALKDLARVQYATARKHLNLNNIHDSLHWFEMARDSYADLGDTQQIELSSKAADVVREFIEEHNL